MECALCPHSCFSMERGRWCTSRWGVLTATESRQRLTHWGGEAVPIYEYTCEECKSRFEKFVRSMTASAEVRCPHCGGTHVKKAWSVFGTGSSGGDLGASASLAASSCSTGGT
jgi:putative FmdB family regulatory protein